MPLRRDIQRHVRWYVEAAEEGRARKRKKVAEYVFEVPPGHARTKRFEEVCRELEDACDKSRIAALNRLAEGSVFGSYEEIEDALAPELQKIMERQYDELIVPCLRQISSRFLEERDFRSVLAVRKSLNAEAFALAEKSDEHESAIGAVATGWMMFLDTAGQSLELSITLGLLALETWTGAGGAISQSAGIVPFVSEEQMLAQMFLVESVSEPEADDSGAERLAGKIGPPNRTLLASGERTPDDRRPRTKAWIQNLVRATSTSAVAEEILQSILEVATQMTHRAPFEVLKANMALPAMTAAEIPEELTAHLKSLGLPASCYGYQTWTPLFLRPQLALPGGCRNAFDAWFEQQLTVERWRKENGERVLQWYEDRWDQLGAALEAKCQAVMSHPRRCLRTGGRDHVDIDVAPLRNAGIRGIAFYPEGSTFPDTRLRVFVRKETPTILVFDAELKDFDLEIHDEAFTRGIHFDDREFLRDMLRFVVVDVLHQIVAGDHGHRDRKWKATGENEGGAKPKSTAVRALLRRLPRGFKASPTAQAKANEAFGAGWKLPSWLTFVSAFLRGGKVDYDLPTPPVVTYGDQDLLNA